MATGEDILRIANAHVGEMYVFGAPAPKDNSSWRGPWDCSEFVSWCVFQASGKLYGCDNDNASPARADAYTGYWDQDAARLGIKVSVETAARIKGAAILRFRGRQGHIVISDGGGGTVEAKGARFGVVRDVVRNRRWDTGILVPGIEYKTGDAQIDLGRPPVIFGVGDTGPLVRRIQEAVAARGFDPGLADGIFGEHTAAAVEAFQLVAGLMPDGEVGPLTAAALDLQLEPEEDRALLATG